MLNLLGKLIVGLLVLGLAVAFWPVTIFVLLLMLGLKLMEKGRKPAPIWRRWHDGRYQYVTSLVTGEEFGPFPTSREVEDFMGGTRYMRDMNGLYSIPDPV